MEITRTLEPAVIPGGRGRGKPTSKVLTDGTMFYCAHEGCGFTSDRFYGVFGHMSIHGAKRVTARRRNYATLDAATRLELEAVLRRVQHNGHGEVVSMAEYEKVVRKADQYKAERDDWRATAREATKTLATLKSALGIPR